MSKLPSLHFKPLGKVQKLKASDSLNFCKFKISKRATYSCEAKRVLIKLKMAEEKIVLIVEDGVCGALKERYPERKIIAVSGCKLEHFLKEGNTPPWDAFIKKPMTPTQLEDIFARFEFAGRLK